MILIDYYRSIERVSIEMLEMAHKSQWGRMHSLEKHCSVLIDELRVLGRSGKLSEEHNNEKIKIMKNILRNDAEIRILAEPWLSKINFSEKSSVLVH